jgi:hypothetical protein
MAQQEFILIDTADKSVALEEQYSSALALWEKTNGSFVGEKRKYYDVALGNAGTVVQVIGVIAGFGFTGVGQVHSINVFMAGEFIVVGGIFYGLLKVRDTSKEIIRGLDKKSASANDVLERWVQFFHQLRLQGVTEGRIPGDTQENITSLNDELNKELRPKQYKDEGGRCDALLSG